MELVRIDVPRIAFGIFLIALGTALTVSYQEWLDVELSLFDFWPLILLILGLLKLLRGDFVGGLLLTGLGVVFALPKLNLGIEYRDILEHWPLFLVAIGAVIVVRSVFPERTRQREGEASAAGRSGLAIFRTVKARPETDEYRGDQLTAVIGGVELELDRVTLHPDGALLEVFAFWGSIEVRVPRTWEVDVHVIPVMGGSEDKTRTDEPTPADAPRLLVRGFVFMGAVEVHH